MRSHFYNLLNELSARTKLPFDSHLEGSRVRFKVDKAYQFGLVLDSSEEFLIFECHLLDKRLVGADPTTFLRWNFAAAYRDGCFVTVDPHTDAIVLISRFPLQGLDVARMVETVEKMLNIADRMVRGEGLPVDEPISQTLDFFSHMRP